MNIAGVEGGERAGGEHHVRLDKRDAGKGCCDALSVGDEVLERRHAHVL